MADTNISNIQYTGATIQKCRHPPTENPHVHGGIEHTDHSDIPRTKQTQTTRPDVQKMSSLSAQTITRSLLQIMIFNNFIFYAGNLIFWSSLE